MLSDRQRLLVEYLIEYDSDLHKVAEAMGETYEYVKTASKRKSVEDEVLDQVKSKLAMLSIPALKTTEELLHADNDTEQGALRQKVASDIFDRIGITKQTPINAETIAQAGVVFMVPKNPVPPEPEQITDLPE